MNIGITGASGFIGRRIIDLALRRGHDITAFSRTPERGIPGCTMRRFSLEEPPDVSGCEGIIHLAGESIAGLWTSEKKRRILESRVVGTRLIVEAMNSADTPPEALVSNSGIGVYEDAGDAEITESSPTADTFLAKVVKAWEGEASKARKARVVFLRTAMVLGKGAGALGAMAPIFRLGLGGKLGSGRQWMPWIHLEDQAMLTLFALENLEVRGSLNATAPWPIRNADFTAALARVLRRPAFFRVPAFALQVLGEFRHELLDSHRAVPAAATEHGFQFRFPELAPALKNLFP